MEKICNFSQLCESGQFSKVLDQLRVPPPTCPSVSVAAASHEASDDDVQVSFSNFQNKEVCRLYLSLIL